MMTKRYDEGTVVRVGGGRLGRVQEYKDGRVILRGVGRQDEAWHADPKDLEPVDEVAMADANTRSWGRT
ncbi:hypothetical protein [Streptomyces sp. BPTC-684]|uniref:hypothetical protein n=1 Tax=Streptomyces sp. BPTC-684 TaxID=3043734 RepID=UPI0024B04663|nr:hypothetical protein [Streptomyces sp. BPTC-684]WHM37399.1 hypothetical protein QIY60_11120 [Streptomyces sp. BPTC-684]